MPKTHCCQVVGVGSSVMVRTIAKHGNTTPHPTWGPRRTCSHQGHHILGWSLWLQLFLQLPTGSGVIQPSTHRLCCQTPLFPLSVVSVQGESE
ncbi:hypothetical protein JZ751_019784 [Albula glossodonta]|uniref:Uncharacterized protein n=1 Tax=Albula glossodonta TaxID=121402 RepID=A0A8T2NPA1_9TELE|nr:hypothetical protein JZ751_019784 [Albula glossodonta]